jgi:hypothetical protein
MALLQQGLTVVALIADSGLEYTCVHMVLPEPNRYCSDMTATSVAHGFHRIVLN